MLDVKYAGKALEEKLEDLRIELDKINSPGLVVNMLDEIAWLFNLRGSDIPYNPVFFSYAFVGKQSASLYIDSSQLDKAGISHLGDKVEVKPYDTIYSDLKTFAEQHAKSLSATGDEATAAKRRKAEKFLVGKRVSWSLSKALGGEDAVEEVRSPIGNAKAVKNETELAGMRAGHVRDGAAITEYFSWLEHELKAGKRKITEVSGADKLLEIRQKMDLFVGLSFPTISSAGPNAAVIHYQPEPETCADISLDGIYLCDCGVQCLDSTTDTTRTVHFGTPTAAERRAYTLVLKGHIALDRAVFPKGTSGMSLDVLARQFLWSEDVYDVPHGIGHGIGSYLNVHEGPISISSRPASAEVPLAAGNVLSNEPGYYEDGKFGVRIENAVLVVPAGRKEREGGKPFFKFEKVTMVPMCRHLLDLPLLTPQEVTWLNDYHVDVLQKTKGHFEERVAKGDESAKIALAWLQKETAPL